MPNGTKVLKLGIVGCGRVTVNHHLSALKKLPGVEVIALADTDKGCLNWAGDRFHIGQRYTDYRFLLDGASLDAVAVCVPPEPHVEIALGGLDAGKDLFIEKPPALNLEEWDRLIERARNAKTKAMVGFNLRHHRLVRQARQIIQQGTLGAIESIHTSLTRDFPEAFSVMLNGRDFLMTYDSEWQYFIDSIQNDTKIECTLEEGRRALQIVSAAVESSSQTREGRSLISSECTKKLINQLEGY